MDGLALVRVQTISGIDAVVENFEALGIVEFRAEEVGVATTDFRTKNPVHARGDGQVFVRTVQKLETVSCEHGDGALAFFGCADVNFTVAKLLVADFNADTANGMVAGDGGVAAWIAPEVIVECTCVVGQVAKDQAYVLERSPAEFHAVKVKCGVAVVCAVDGSRTGESVADFCSLVCIRYIALCVCVNGHRNIFVEICLHVQIDVLVGGVRGVKVLVEVAREVKIDIPVDFDVSGRCKTGSCKGNRQNDFTHTILPKKIYLIFTSKR